MKSITAKWFECAIQYEKVMENGTEKKITEKYVVEALSFTEAEASIIKETSPFIRGEYEVKAIVPQAYREVFFTGKEEDDRYFKVKVAFITLDEKTGSEKRTMQPYLVQARTSDDAFSNTKTAMSGSMVDYEIVSVVETKVMDVFMHEGK